MGTYIRTFVERSTEEGWVYQDLSDTNWVSSWQQYSSFAVLSGVRDRDGVGERFLSDFYPSSADLPSQLEGEWQEGVSGSISCLSWDAMRNFNWDQLVDTTCWVEGKGDVPTQKPVKDYASDLYDTYVFMSKLDKPEELRLLYWYE